MVRALLPAGPCSPHHRREYQYREQEKCPGDFKPDLAADGAKGLEEAAESPRDSARGLPSCARLAGNASIASRACGSARLLWCSGALRVFPRHGLTGHAAGNAQTDAQHPSDGLRLHSVTPLLQPRGFLPVAGAGYHPCNQGLLHGTPDMMVAAADMRAAFLHPMGDASCRIDA
jgi:hypothetical protein